MNAFEFESELHHQDQLTIPRTVAVQLKEGQRVRVVILVMETDADSAVEMPPPPYAKFAGTWDPNDPRIEEWKKAVEQYRREVDADPNIA